MSEIQKLDNGLVIPENITEEEHRQLMMDVVGAEHEAQNTLKRCQWKLGDAYNAIPWGDKKAYCQSFGKWPDGKWKVNYNTARNCGVVAEAFSIPVNVPPVGQLGDVEPEQNKKPHRTTLPWTVHQAAMDKTTPAQRADLVERAIAAKTSGAKAWSKRVMDLERKKLLGEAVDAPLEKKAAKTLVDHALESLPKSTPKSVKPIIRKLIKDLGSQYHAELQAAVSERCAQERKDHAKAMAEYNAQKAFYEKAVAGVARPIEPDEFRILRQFCHPDKHPGNEAKAGQAYEIVMTIGERLQLAKKKAG